jgi:alpha-maltose-1-phosphate synthase
MTAPSEKKSTLLLIDNQGLSHYTSYLACGLQKYYNVILCGFSQDDFVITGAKEKKVKFYDVAQNLPKATSIVSKIIRPLLLFFPLLDALTKLKYDIVHFQGQLPLFFLFIPILKLKGKPICWTLHDVNLRPTSAGLRGKLEILFLKAITQPRLLGKYADIIIVHGKLLKNELMAKGVNQNKIYVIPHFDYNYLLNSNRTRTSGDYVLLFGRIKPYKGIEVFIDAARIVRQKIGPRFQVLIVGKGDYSYFLNSMTEDDYKYIKFRNEFIPSSEIQDVFTNALFVVLPYTYASQSGVLPLAYTFSRPVIVSNAGSIGEFVEHGKTGFIFETENRTQLANYMIQLIEEDSKRVEMGKNGNQKLLDEMSLEKCCEIINNLYKQI